LDDDATLLEAWRTGDRDAATRLVERHFVALYRFFRSKVSGEIDDFVQQTLMGCLEARESFRGEACFRTLLFRIARRRLYDYFRARRRLADIDFTISSVLALGTTPSAALQRHDAVSLVREALQELPVDDQMLLELRYWQELTTEQLAEVFEVAVGTIKSRQSRARARLLERLRERGLSDIPSDLSRVQLPSSP
jgi:RNA polymerase sigma factor (sigma-70 family)